MNEPPRPMRAPDTGRRARRGPGRGADGPPPVHFLHVGKTGGTALRDAIERAGRRPAGGARVVRLHGHGTRLRDVPRGEKFFFFVRDPVGRFVSGFGSRRRWGLPRHFVPWSAPELAAFRRFATPGRLACALSSPDADERSAARSAMRGIGHVRDGYRRWFESEAYFLSRLDDLFFIGFQPDLAADFEILKSRLGLPEGLSLPHDPVRSHRSPRGPDRALGATALGNLRAWYDEDYRFVALCERVIRENPHVRPVRGGGAAP